MLKKCNNMFLLSNISPVYRVSSYSSMYEMKYFRTLILIIIFWTIPLCDSTLSKSKLIKPREIFDNGNIVSIDSILRAGSTDTSRHHNVLHTSTKCTYADVIVDLLQTFFEIFLYGVNSHENNHTPGYTKNWLISAINHFNNIKTPVAKMIDNLFGRSDRAKLLRTTDQSLLKSLLSINLFLYYSINSSPFIVYSDVVTNFISDDDLIKTIENVRVLNTSIIQMIGLVERFRSKRCVVHDPYEYNYIIHEKLNDVLINDAEIISSLLESPLLRLNVLVNDGSDNYDDFDKKLYDPEYLLFKNVLDHNNSFLGNIRIHWNGQVSDLISIYNDVKNMYSIEHVLEFQHTLIKVIADVFYTQIYNLSNYSQLFDITDLNDLHSNFVKFTNKMLPNNCSITVCNKILKSQIIFGKVLANYNHSTSTNVFMILLDVFEPRKNIELILLENSNQEFQQEFVEPSLSFFFGNIWNDTQYKSFKRVLRLLSYEAYTNSVFHITCKLSDHENISSSFNYDTTFLKSMIEVQYALFAFWILLKMENNHKISNNVIHYSNTDLHDISSIGFTTSNNATDRRKKKLHEKKCRESERYGPLFSEILQVIVKLYKQLDDKPEVQDILLPLLVHFQYTNELFCQEFKYELSMTLQMSFLTITVVENYLIKNYSSAFYSLFIYSTFVMNDENGPDFSKLRHDLQTCAEISKNNFKGALRFLNYLYDVNTYSDFFPYHDEQITFSWNGRKQFGYEIFQNVTKGVIDLNDLIGLQWFGIKWSVSNILMKISDALTLLENENKLNEIYIIQNKLNELLSLEFPMAMPIQLLLNDIVNGTLRTLNTNWTTLYLTIFHPWKTILKSGLTVLDAHPTTIHLLSYPELEYIMRGINYNIRKLNKLTSWNFLPVQNNVDLNDFSLSPVEKKMFNTIIEILYQVY